MHYFYYPLYENWRCNYLEEFVYKFIKPDLLVLIPVLFLIGNALKKSMVKDCKIPFIIGSLGILLAIVWILSTEDIFGVRECLTAVFAGFCQGVLISGASVFFKQLNIQLKK